MAWIVVWDNGHACGSLSGRYETEKEAQAAGDAWHADMVSIDPDPDEAAEAYSFECVESDDAPEVQC